MTQQEYIEMKRGWIVADLMTQQGNNALNIAAFKGAMLFAYGLSEQQFFNDLMAATTQPIAAARATIKSGFRAGKAKRFDWSRINLSGNHNQTRQEQKQKKRMQAKNIAKAAKERQGKVKRQAKFLKSVQDQGQPVAGTPAQHYLEKRGLWPCDTSRMAYLASYPHWQEQQQQDGSLKWVKSLHPAIVFLASKSPTCEAESGLILSLDRTGNKADLSKASEKTGKVKNDARRFAPLYCGLGYWTHGYKDNQSTPVCDTLILCEGIENAHSIALMRHDSPLICAALSSGNMANITPPQGIKTVILAGDNDKAGQAANHKAAQKLALQGYEVKAITPPKGQDWNDLVLTIIHKKEAQ